MRHTKSLHGWVWKELMELRKVEANLKQSYQMLATAGHDGIAEFLSSLAELDRRSLRLEQRLDGGAS